MKILTRAMLAACTVCATCAAEAAIDLTEVSVTNGEVVLAGTLMQPPDGAPHPGLVLVAGSGPGERSELHEVARRFVDMGMAVLIYDKRGSGQSGGNWITSSLTDLADDAAAAFRFLTDQPTVDADRAGYWGISQGGWVLPLAVGETSPAFAIAVTGGGLTPREVETARYRQLAQAADSSHGAVRDAQLVLDAYFEYLASDRSRKSLMAVIEGYRGEAWLSALGIERVIPGENNRHNWAWVATFDPRTSIQQLTVPVLVLLGGKDPLTPAERTANAWRESLGPGIEHNRVEVLDDAGHGMRTEGHGGPFVESYFPSQQQWLQRIGMLNKATASEVSTAGTLVVRVQSLASNEGQLRFTLFDSKKHFLKRPVLAEAVDIQNRQASWTVEELSYGTYAVLVHHDTNASGTMERHWYGKPKEPTGASNNPPPRMGPPKFNQVKFQLDSPRRTLDIALNVGD